MLHKRMKRDKMFNTLKVAQTLHVLCSTPRPNAKRRQNKQVYFGPRTDGPEFTLAAST